MGPGGDDGELIAADAGQGVGGAQDRLGALGDLAEDRVADRVAVVVVDPLEVVEVEDQQRQRAWSASRRAPGGWCGGRARSSASRQTASVGDPGQGVSVGDVALAQLGGQQPRSRPTSTQVAERKPATRAR